MIVFFLAIFHRPWVCQGLWKIAKPPKNCTGWPVEMSNPKMTSNLVFDKMAFSLNSAVVIHPNGPKCLRNEQIPSLLGQDTLWVLLTMVWSHYFAVLSLILASGVAYSPLASPGAPLDPWNPPDPWYVTPCLTQKSWVIMGHI